MLKTLLTDLRLYLAACFRSTVRDWERQQFMGTFIAALLTLPLGAYLVEKFGWAAWQTSTITLVGVGILFLIISPFRVWQEKTKEIVALRGAIDDVAKGLKKKSDRSERNRQSATSLQKFIERANELIKRPVANESEFAQWLANFNSWLSEATSFVRSELGHVAESNFNESFLAFEIVWPSGRTTYNSDHSSHLSRLVTLRDRLKKMHAFAMDDST